MFPTLIKWYSPCDIVDDNEGLHSIVESGWDVVIVVFEISGVPNVQFILDPIYFLDFAHEIEPLGSLVLGLLLLIVGFLLMRIYFKHAGFAHRYIVYFLHLPPNSIILTLK